MKVWQMSYKSTPEEPFEVNIKAYDNDNNVIWEETVDGNKH